MEHIELHIVDTSADLESCYKVGLLEEEVIYDFICANCDNAVSHYEEMFYSFVFVLSEDAEWFICEECATPTIYPLTFDESN
jgi:hypothetical protein